MKYFNIWSGILFTCCILSFLFLVSRDLNLVATSSGAQVSNEQVKQDLWKLTKALNIGVRSHDTTAIKNIVASEYQLTGPKFSQQVPREKWLVYCFLWSFDSAMLTIISLSGWVEVTVFRSLQQFHNFVVGRNEPSAKSEVWITDLWMKRDERWQIVTRLSERLPKK